MQLKLRIILCILLCSTANAMSASAERMQRQQQLDVACEMAREQKLAPLRQQYIEACVQQRRGDQAWCEWFYHDYGDTSGRRAALFYDLPECVEAFEYRRSYRRPD